MNTQVTVSDGTFVDERVALEQAALLVVDRLIGYDLAPDRSWRIAYCALCDPDGLKVRPDHAVGCPLGDLARRLGVEVPPR